MSQADAFDCRQRQLCEVEALQSMYDVDGSFVVDDTDAHELLKATVESCSAPEAFGGEGLPCLSFRIAHSDTEDTALSHSVKFLLPEAYPVSQHAVCRIEWEIGSRADHEFLNGVIDQYSESLRGEESCFMLVQRARELIQEAQAEKTQDIAEDLALQEAVRMVQDVQISERKRVLGRRLIYFHHIINEGKRQCIIEWAVQLQLGGYSKIGWPGVIVVEGPEECCQEYVRSLQRLRWQLMVVRGEEMEECPEDSSIDDLRKMHRGFEETDNMSLLAERCRQAGLEELFLTSMKIYGGRGGEESKKGAGAEQAEARGKKGGAGKRR